MDSELFRKRLDQTIDAHDAGQARRAVAPFVRNPQALEVRLQGFFRDVGGRLRFVQG
jgi:hypothetical protein